LEARHLGKEPIVTWLTRLGALWRNLTRRDRAEQDLDDELRATFDLVVEEKTRGGMAADEARPAAALELGRVETVKEAIRNARAGALLDELGRDVRYAARRLSASPLFTTLAIVLVAGGIATSATVFGVVNAVLWRPQPFDAPERLVHLYQDSKLLPGAIVRA
jgi:hypothetical protein